MVTKFTNKSNFLSSTSYLTPQTRNAEGALSGFLDLKEAIK